MVSAEGGSYFKVGLCHTITTTFTIILLLGTMWSHTRLRGTYAYCQPFSERLQRYEVLLLGVAGAVLSDYRSGIGGTRNDAVPILSNLHLVDRSFTEGPTDE